MKTLLALAAGLVLGAGGYAAAQETPEAPIPEHFPESAFGTEVRVDGSFRCSAVAYRNPVRGATDFKIARLRCRMAQR